jgi:outer membrane receptor for ferrienterochelin and colicins
MQKTIALLLAIIFACTVHAQYSFKTIIKNSKTKEPLPGVSVVLQSTGKGAASDKNGFVELTGIPSGQQTINFTYYGYEVQSLPLVFPMNNNDTLEILLEEKEAELEEVIIQSTRTSRTIQNSPTRVETIDGEELDEKNNMRPANVSMLLHESTGLQVQQTSASTGNASIRVQGLDGRYTQVLKDGYPNFGNFSSGLSILEIPPLDLKQVEIIKGPASTLYGGGAIAGVVNFISKTPKEKFEGDFILNQSNIGQTNIGGYISQRKGRIGFSLLATANFSKEFDVDKDRFSEIPKNSNFTIVPRLFFYPDAVTSIMIGNSYTNGLFTGGDMQVIKGNASSTNIYFERNKTKRNISTLEIERKFGKQLLRLKQSLAIFNRNINIPGYTFEGTATNSYTDISYIIPKEKHIIIGGLNLVYDRFRQLQNTAGANLASNSFTSGAYLQDTWDLSGQVKIESGLRLDHINYKNANFSRTETFLLPRVSLLFRITDQISSRIGGGLGYKAPTVFTEQTESVQYQNVATLSNVRTEKSIGGTADINFSKSIGANVDFSINQLFFITQISKPLVLDDTNPANRFFYNAGKPIISKGFETNMKLIYKEDLKLFMGYTFTNTRAMYRNGNKFLVLLPKHKINLSLMYEKEDNFKIGLESYFTDRQYLSDGSRTPSFWEFGIMGQKTFNHFSFFLNFENFTDQRQSRYKRVVNPPESNPTFDEIWNHTEGFVFNGGVKIKL